MPYKQKRRSTTPTAAMALAAIVAFTLASCSTTSSLDDGEQLFTGLLDTDYHNFTPSAHQTVTQEEVEAAIATAPNGALFGSSYHRTPFPYALWIWNACSESHGVIKKWLNSSFGKPPVLMSNVNPALRSSVARTVLQNNGYFNGNVTYDIEEGKPRATDSDTTLLPRTAKIRYHVDFGHLYTLDSVRYTNYPDKMLKALRQSPSPILKRDNPFSISSLDTERNRIYTIFRNQGYYYYQKSYTSYLADTIAAPGKVQLQVRMNDSLPSHATRRWVIGSTEVRIRRQMAEQLKDSVRRQYLSIFYNGEKSPLRPGVLLRGVKLRPGDIFSEEKHEESLNQLSSMGIFSGVDITFSPRLDADGNPVQVPDSIKDKHGLERAGAGVMDMTVSATLDKPYDLTFTATGEGKTNGRVGPGLTLGLTKRNAFRGGEILTAAVGASYEFQTGLDNTTGSSYDFSTSLSLTIPRLLIPRFLYSSRRRWHTTPSTQINIAGETIRRAGFFRRNILSGEISYFLQPSPTSQHHITPFSLVYGRTNDVTPAYLDKISTSTASLVATADELIPRMRYRYIHTSPLSLRNPIHWETTVTEAGNLTNLLTMAFTGKRWNERDKSLLETPFSQFVKVETDLRKTWATGGKSSFVARFFAGVIASYGNSASVPYAEQFFIGGANDLRGFSLHSIGPGSVRFEDRDIAYLMHTGDTKVVLNLEYRPHLFGSLYGALFLDAGNIWYLNSDRAAAMDDFFDYGGGDVRRLDVGVNVGCGLRYDLDFFVLRVDWGLAIHTPYSTSASGFFNIPKFKDAHCLNLAIGYPF